MFWWYLRSEKSCAQVAYEATDGVHGEDIQRVVDPQQELKLRSIIACRSRCDTVDDSGPGRHVPRSWRDGHETSDDAGAETNGRPFLLETVVEEAPGHAADAGCEIRDNSGHDGAHAGG